MGLSPYHVHGVALDCIANQTRLQLYGQVDVMEIPAKLLDKSREENRKLCETDPLMTGFATKMEYVCARVETALCS